MHVTNSSDRVDVPGSRRYDLTRVVDAALTDKLQFLRSPTAAGAVSRADSRTPVRASVGLRCAGRIFADSVTAFATTVARQTSGP